MPQPDYPQTDATVESAKRSAAAERKLNIPLIGWDVDEDGIVQHDVRKNADRLRRPA
jgi:hypothetical protein